jgi:TonB family protein
MSARNDSRTLGFVLVSTVTHVALTAGVLALNVRSQGRVSEVTQIEVATPAESTPAPVDSQAPIRSETTKQAEAPLPEKMNTEAPSAPAQPLIVQKAIPTSLPAAKHAARTQPAAPVTKETPTQEESPVLAPIAEGAQLQAPVEDSKPELKDEDIAEDLQKVDQEENTNVAAVHQELSQKAEEEMKEQDAKLAALEKANQEESDHMAQEQKAQQERERQALAAAATERMAREAQAAREAEQARAAEAAKQAEETRLAELAKAQAIVAGQSPTGTGRGAGEGPSDSQADVRALSELKQMPGNKAPQYDADDRLQGRQGEVAFLAYVSQDGFVTQFKLLQSSGHRVLDAKTLKAIKGWKFYPGQEGWVEIPFKWDLKGGPQEMPMRLRLKSQASQN